MRSLYDGQITDIIPGSLNQAADVKALSYAVMKAMQKLQDYANRAKIYSNIEKLSENILDILAVEFRSQYYSQDMDIDTKRRVINETMQWYSLAGTPIAVEKLISAVFLTGEIIEWYKYGGDPGHFKIITENHGITGDALQNFNRIISRVKRKSAILDAVEITLTAYMNTYYGAVLHTCDYINLIQEG